MSDAQLSVLNYALLGLVYLFFARVLWAVWSEVRGPQAGVRAPSGDATLPGVPPTAGARREPSRKVPRGVPTRLVVVEPKVRKTANFVTDVEVLVLAKELLREVTTHVIAELQGAHDSFFAVGDRAAMGEQFRVDRAKKSGRPVPDAQAPKGQPTLKAPPTKPSPGARKA